MAEADILAYLPQARLTAVRTWKRFPRLIGDRFGVNESRASQLRTQAILHARTHLHQEEVAHG